MKRFYGFGQKLILGYPDARDCQYSQNVFFVFHVFENGLHLNYHKVVTHLLIFVQNLIELGVKKLVLPAAATVLNTWTMAFGYTPVTQSERSEFLSYSFLDFQDTVMCQKVLRRLSLPLPHLLRDTSGMQVFYSA